MELLLYRFDWKNLEDYQGCLKMQMGKMFELLKFMAEKQQRWKKYRLMKRKSWMKKKSSMNLKKLKLLVMSLSVDSSVHLMIKIALVMSAWHFDQCSRLQSFHLFACLHQSLWLIVYIDQVRCFQQGQYWNPLLQLHRVILQLQEQRVLWNWRMKRSIPCFLDWDSYQNRCWSRGQGK